MTDKNQDRAGLRAAAVLLALLGATTLPAASAQETADNVTVVRDADTGKLRAPTAEELTALQAKKFQGLAKAAVARASTPSAPLAKINPTNGAVGLRITDEMATLLVVTRAADGSLQEQHVESLSAAQAAVAHGTLSAVPSSTQPVTE